MKNSIPAPLERLRWFQAQLNLDTKTLEKVGECRPVFLRQKEQFAKYFHKHFYQIPETRVSIEHEKHEGYLQKAWTEWFESLFGKDFDQSFLTYQWFSGSRHAKVGIDHNLITLGYSFLRQFCHEIVKTEIPEKDRVPVLEGIDKMADFCLLIETQAFISATIQCDIEVVRGISHQVKGDREGLETMFFYLLENSLEAADPETPLIEISSRPWSGAAPFIEVEVFNNGEPPSMEDVANLFVPFYSSKPYGSGFGLAIAQLAARKSLGDLHLEPVQDKGLRCVIKLPAPFKANKEKGSVKK